MKKTFVVSVGGSLIVPDDIDYDWLKNFKKIIVKNIKKGHNFIFVSGGGKTARKYQNALKNICSFNSKDLDWIGIDSTRLNARLLLLTFKDYSYDKIIIDPNTKISSRKKVIVGAGWKPGFSTDYISVLLAEKFKAEKVINLSNIDYVYTKDPKKFKDAKKIENISWTEFRKIVGNKWDPGLNAPFDPVASKKSQSLGLEVAILNGKNIENFDFYLNEKNFFGTVIKGR